MLMSIMVDISLQMESLPICEASFDAWFNIWRCCWSCSSSKLYHPFEAENRINKICFESKIKLNQLIFRIQTIIPIFNLFCSLESESTPNVASNVACHELLLFIFLMKIRFALVNSLLIGLSLIDCNKLIRWSFRIYKLRSKKAFEPVRRE